jgi:hypothetical protein
MLPEEWRGSKVLTMIPHQEIVCSTRLEIMVVVVGASTDRKLWAAGLRPATMGRHLRRLDDERAE